MLARLPRPNLWTELLGPIGQRKHSSLFPFPLHTNFGISSPISYANISTSKGDPTELYYGAVSRSKKPARRPREALGDATVTERRKPVKTRPQAAVSGESPSVRFPRGKSGDIRRRRGRPRASVNESVRTPDAAPTPPRRQRQR